MKSNFFTYNKTYEEPTNECTSNTEMDYSLYKNK